MQEPEYYYSIMLLVGEKIGEIVKVCDTIDCGLKTRKIARVDALLGSSGRRLCCLLQGEEDPPEDHHPSKVVLDISRILTGHAIRKLVIQILLLPPTKMLHPHTKMPPSKLPNSSPIYQNVAPNGSNVQSNY